MIRVLARKRKVHLIFALTVMEPVVLGCQLLDEVEGIVS
jgi:hypothetical protein